MKVNKNFTLLIICILHLQIVLCQQRICLDFKVQQGTAGLSFEDNNNQLEDSRPIFNQNLLSAGVLYKIGKYIEFGIHALDQKSNFNFADNQVISLSNGEYIKLKSKSSVHVQAISTHFSFFKPIKDREKLQWITSIGYNFGTIKPQSGLPEFKYKEPEVVITQTSPNDKYASAFMESGINIKLSKYMDWKIIGGYNISFQPIYKGTYSVQTSNYSGTSTLLGEGSGAFVATSLSFAIINIKKKEKKVARYSPQYNDKNEVISIDGREVLTAQEIKVSRDEIEIQVWDYGKEDGDKISLFLDGKRLLKKYVLKSKRLKMNVKLKPGINKLIVYAHNLGKEPPNTASIIVNDGNTKQLLSLQSTLGECGSISVIYEP